MNEAEPSLSGRTWLGARRPSEGTNFYIRTCAIWGQVHCERILSTTPSYKKSEEVDCISEMQVWRRLGKRHRGDGNSLLSIHGSWDREVGEDYRNFHGPGTVAGALGIWFQNIFINLRTQSLLLAFYKGEYWGSEKQRTFPKATQPHGW